VSIVYYFALNEDFDPLQQADQNALKLFERMVGTLRGAPCALR
jgi:hypothetical protein